MALSTNLTKPVTMIPGTTANASDVNTMADYVVDQINITNKEVDTRIPSPGTSTGRYLRDDGTWGTIPGITGFRGALVYNTVAVTNGVMAWLSESYDTDNIHALNATTLVVPPGVSKVQLSALVAANPAAGAIYSLLKNGQRVVGGAASVGSAGEVGGTSPLTSAILSVSPGDYFEITSVSTTLTEPTGFYSWFSMRVIE